MNNKINKKKNKQHNQQQKQPQQQQQPQAHFEVDDIEEAELDIIEDPIEQLDQTEELNQINQYQIEQFIQQQKQELSLLPPHSLQKVQPKQQIPLKTIAQQNDKKEIVLGWIEKSILSNIYPTNPIGQLVTQDKNIKKVNNRELSLFLSDKISTIRINFSEESLRATFDKNSLSVGNLAGSLIEIQDYRISPDIHYFNFVLYIYKFSIISKVKVPNISLIPISKQTKIVNLLNLKREMIKVNSQDRISFSESIISPDQAKFLDSLAEWKTEQPQVLYGTQFEEGSQLDSKSGSVDKNNNNIKSDDKVMDFQYEYSGDEIEEEEVGGGNQAISQLLASIKETREREDKNYNNGKRKFSEFENDPDEFAELFKSVQQQDNEPVDNHLGSKSQDRTVEDDNQLDEDLFDDFQPSSFIDLEKSSNNNNNNNKNGKTNITAPKKNSLSFEKYNPPNQQSKQQQQNKTPASSTTPSLIKTTSASSNTTTTATTATKPNLKPIIPTVPMKPTKNIAPSALKTAPTAKQETSTPKPTITTNNNNNNNNNINNSQQNQQNQQNQIDNDFEIFNLQLGIKSSNGLDINKSMRFLLEDQSCKHVIEVGGLEIVIKRKRNIE